MPLPSRIRISSRSMRMRRHPERLIVVVGFVAVAAAAVVLSRGGLTTSEVPPAAFTWRGLVGDVRPLVAIGQRQIVLLRTPSLAEHLAKVGFATEAQERGWTAQAFAAQKGVLAMLSKHGLGVRPDYSFARVLDGFSAQLDPRAVALLDADPAVRGVYPVRAAFPTALSTASLARASSVSTPIPPPIALPGFDGRGVTVALLDTGVDRSQPYLRGRILPGLDVVNSNVTADAQPDPQNSSRREQHGTELAGLLVGSGGPQGLHGVATGATVLPIRVAGWQLDAAGRDVVYSRSDQIIAGLDVAVDPNGDGDAHDAARVAVLGVAEPFAAFADAPESLAVAGALALDTLVVVPAGNDGIAGPAFGSISGPGGSPAALTVGASDSRSTTPAVRVVLRRGLDVIFDGPLPILGTVAPKESVVLGIGIPKPHGTQLPGLTDFFDAHGLSLVAGRAALVAGGDDPAAVAAAAAAAGAKAVLVYGSKLPAGPLDLPTEVNVPVVGVPLGSALGLLSARSLGIDTGISLGVAQQRGNTGSGSVATFSSRGLSFDGRVKPDLIAPGVGLATSNSGVTAVGEPAFATVSGTSAAAASVAGAALLLAQARPDLDAPALKSLLVGYAQRIPGAPSTEQGAGSLNVGLSIAGEIAAAPTSLAFGSWTGPPWSSEETIVARNVSSHRLHILVAALADGVAKSLHFSIVPSSVVIAAGQETTIHITVSASSAPSVRLVTGVIRLAASDGQSMHVPWAVDSGPLVEQLLTKITLSQSTFTPSDLSPALLDVEIGRISTTGGIQIQPVSRLEIDLAGRDGKSLGLLTRQRDLLPGRYRFGLTGRAPTGAPLPPGRYSLRLAAWPTVPGLPSRAIVRFTIK
jgi:subtilisin family serine protease